jgi:uncharacterized repeat protein (TIGR03803 family)
MRALLRCALLFALVLLVGRSGLADVPQYKLTTLASFNGMNGISPACALVADASGNLYGTTTDGGANNKGTVFELTAGTNVLTPIVSFNGSNGAYPEDDRLLIDASGNLFGTTQQGGAANNGTVFEVAAGSHALNTLATFPAFDTGLPSPNGGLVADAAGNLYGTTSTSGHGFYGGAVYKVAAVTHSLTVR